MSELSQAIEQMRNMRESYNQIGAAAEAYNTGKNELAANITAKGVPAAASETLPELAEKVSAIAQESYTIDGGEMYAKQLYGVANNDIVPGYWNLYEILEQLLSDGRLVNYGGILLAEYYKGYDSLALSGAGAGGAYVVSDKDSDGNFIMYTADTTHVWDTAFDGKGNRWVAYCFADAGHDFDITDTNTSPRSIHIGRYVGKITSLVDGRTSEIVVTDGNRLGEWAGEGHTQNWGKSVHIIADTIGRNMIVSQPEVEKVFIKAKNNKQMDASGGILHSLANLTTVILKIDGWMGQYGAIDSVLVQNCTRIKNVIIESPSVLRQVVRDIPNLVISFIDIEEMAYPSGGENIGGSIEKVYFAYKTNDKTKTIEFKPYSMSLLLDVELLEGWCKPLSISTLTALTEANMYAHILQRLKQDEAGCGDGVTITLGATNLAKLTSDESIALLDSLTNTYGYTFA